MNESKLEGEILNNGVRLQRVRPININARTFHNLLISYLTSVTNNVTKD